MDVTAVCSSFMSEMLQQKKVASWFRVSSYSGVEMYLSINRST